jgi:hypothetical protein
MKSACLPRWLRSTRPSRARLETQPSQARVSKRVLRTIVNPRE